MRVLLVEDHPATLFGLMSMLRFEEDMEVAGEARDAGEAVRLAGELEPDLVILDLRLKGEMSSIEACREMKSLPEPPHILVYSAYSSRKDVSLCLLSGAESYVHKGEDPEKLLEAMRRTCAGEKVWLPGEELEESGSFLRSMARTASLSPREREVLCLMIEGYTNARIARELCISVPTVKTHARHILRKLGAARREELF